MNRFILLYVKMVEVISIFKIVFLFLNNLVICCVNDLVVFVFFISFLKMVFNKKMGNYFVVKFINFFIYIFV